MKPEHLFVPCGGALRAFGSVVFAPDMPTVDLGAALSQLVWAVSYEPAASVAHNLQGLAFSMAYRDALFEHAELNGVERSMIFNAARILGLAIHAKLQEVKAYRDGVLPYALEGMLDHDTIILRLNRPEPTASS